MKSLPADLVIEKNKIATNSAWLVLLHIKMNDPDESILRFVRNTEDVVFLGETYLAFPFEIDQTMQDSKGQIPSISLRISNATRLFYEKLELYEGGIGSVVTIAVVNSAYLGLGEQYAELVMTFDVIGCTATQQWCTFVLGAPNPLLKRFPKYRYISSHCGWKFGGIECGYSVDDEWSFDHGVYTINDLVYIGDPIFLTNRTNYKCSATHSSSLTNKPGTRGGMNYWGATPCSRTLSDCRLYENSARFGGYVGLEAGGLKIV